ncbi:GNAT family N-acetyltransferase [Aureimonas altamirensis]|jgi:RimJ/RimL family protein N-acetyltransferase|uniref:Protein N-acetyltransferase, RimJ/RimL family n=1 Tax=Aureimonas altamirensis DSM 21988 TaxID=1121026 RepID=A0ABY1IEC6_9HYPH|nr:GNAT family N-acetyltransferase [Aureimonas altamirensis]SHJ04911.1 Protein N-acetyltransferase, RimJ/RimL family [Aureimonas altamirensis DSM 21988]
MPSDDLWIEEELSPLPTRRLTLREVRMDDAPAIATLANDRHIAEMTARIPYPYRLEDAKEFLARTRHELTFAIMRNADDAFMGLISLREKDDSDALDLGYWLGRPFWNKGYATEAAHAVIDYAFGELAAEAVEIRCRVINNASRRVIHKCGFHYQGVGMDVSAVAGRVASESYRMDRRCWLSLKSWVRDTSPVPAGELDQVS